MPTRFANLWEQLRSSYWFVPTLMALAAVLLSFGTIALDEWLQREVERQVGLIWAGGPEGARGLLSTVASSMLSVAGVTFSITITTLSLASSQFGPHLIRKFMRDTSNQVVLGTFVATFLYSLLVLRTVRTGDGSLFVPYISVTITLVLALAGTGVLIYFIHHVASSIQAPHIIAAINHDLEHAIAQLFPSMIGQEAPDGKQERTRQDVPKSFEDNSHVIIANSNGYLQAIKLHRLMKIACENDLILRLESCPGRFIMYDMPLVTAWPRDRIDEELQNKIKKTIVLARQNNLTQDVQFAITQMTEIAVRSLSPGINDPFTAIICVDWLSAALSRIAEKDRVSPYRYDDHAQLRLIAPTITFVEFLDTAFDPIRQSALSPTTLIVVMHLLDAIQRLAGRVRDGEQLAALVRHTRLLEQGIRQQVSDAPDQDALLERYQATMQVLDQQQEALNGAGTTASYLEAV